MALKTTSLKIQDSRFYVLNARGRYTQIDWSCSLIWGRKTPKLKRFGNASNMILKGFVVICCPPLVGSIATISNVHLLDDSTWYLRWHKQIQSREWLKRHVVSFVVSFVVSCSCIGYQMEKQFIKAKMIRECFLTPHTTQELKRFKRWVGTLYLKQLVTKNISSIYTSNANLH